MQSIPARLHHSEMDSDKLEISFPCRIFLIEKERDELQPALIFSIVMKRMCLLDRFPDYSFIDFHRGKELLESVNHKFIHRERNLDTPASQSYVFDWFEERRTKMNDPLERIRIYRPLSGGICFLETQQIMLTVEVFRRVRWHIDHLTIID